MTPGAESAIEKMAAMQKRKDRRAPARELVEHSVDAPVALSIFGGHQKSLDGVLFASCGNVNFREIQVELRLITLAFQRGVAEFFGFIPILLGAGKSESKVGAIMLLCRSCGLRGIGS
jgi:hypothetical protein